jgi:hypothetical protein
VIIDENAPEGQFRSRDDPTLYGAMVEEEMACPEKTRGAILQLIYPVQLR